MTKDKMVGWHDRLNGHEFDQTLGDGEGQGILACFSPWGHKESDTTERLNNNSSKQPNMNGNAIEFSFVLNLMLVYYFIVCFQ